MAKADRQLAESPSQIFDAVAIVLSKDRCASLLREGAEVQFAIDAFGHLKAIGASDAAKPLLEKAGIEADDGVTRLDKTFAAAAARRVYEREPSVRTLA